MKSRRPRGIRTKKISVSVSADDLLLLSARAKRAHDGNISAVVHELVDRMRREQAADDVLEMLGGKVSGAEMDAVRAEIHARSGKRKRRRAA